MSIQLSPESFSSLYDFNVVIAHLRIFMYVNLDRFRSTALLTQVRENLSIFDFGGHIP